MKYFRIGYCPPNPGPNSRIYELGVRAYSENAINSAIQYAKEHPHMPLYVKASYGKKYVQITFEKLLTYAK